MTRLFKVLALAAIALLNVPVLAAAQVITSGAPSSGWQCQATVAVSGASSVTIGSFDSSADLWEIVFNNLAVSSDGADVWLRYKVGGSVITASSYGYAGSYVKEGTASVTPVQASSQAQLKALSGVSSSTNFTNEGSVIIANPADTSKYKLSRWEAVFAGSSGLRQMQTGGGVSGDSTGAVTDIQILPSTGTLSLSYKLCRLPK